jgi:hydroxyacylglutathione hydrolase
MILERFYDEKLAQASYLVGCAATGEALVVDPNRDVDQYLRAADHRGLHITHITETHIHADFVSGTRELAARTGAQMYLSDEGDADWKYAFADDDHVTLVKDGHTFMVGNVKIEVLHTPGHTPEHIVFMLTDTAATQKPMGIFTGDFIFVGDVGRPDLLERAAHIEGTMEASARRLFQSLQRAGNLPDSLQIWPGHGAGSACGKALGAVPQTTLGYERAVNWAFRYDHEDAFVTAVLDGQPEPPKYFAEMKRVNKEGPRILHGITLPERLPESAITRLLDQDAVIVDTRRWADYSAGHIPGTISIPLSRSFTTWAGWLIPYDRDFYLIVDEEHGATGLGEAVRDLALIGLDRVAGYFGVDVVDDWQSATRQLHIVHEIEADDLARELQAVQVIDVRGHSEWIAGHIPGSLNIPLGYLPERIDELATDRPVVLQCQTDPRSSIASSVLMARGVTNVRNLRGGIAMWQATGHPVVQRELAGMTS